MRYSYDYHCEIHEENTFNSLMDSGIRSLSVNVTSQHNVHFAYKKPLSLARSFTSLVFHTKAKGGEISYQIISITVANVFERKFNFYSCNPPTSRPPSYVTNNRCMPPNIL